MQPFLSIIPYKDSGSRRRSRLAPSGNTLAGLNLRLICCLLKKQESFTRSVRSYEAFRHFNNV